MAEYSLQTLMDMKNENQQFGNYLQSVKRVRNLTIRKKTSQYDTRSPNFVKRNKK